MKNKKGFIFQRNIHPFYRKSVFYQPDLDHTAREWTHADPELPEILPASESPVLHIHNQMFRDRISRYRGLTEGADETAAFQLCFQ
jgi:hypothetical protein